MLKECIFGIFFSFYSYFKVRFTKNDKIFLIDDYLEVPICFAFFHLVTIWKKNFKMDKNKAYFLKSTQTKKNFPIFFKFHWLYCNF